MLLIIHYPKPFSFKLKIPLITSLEILPGSHLTIDFDAREITAQTIYMNPRRSASSSCIDKTKGNLY